MAIAGLFLHVTLVLQEGAFAPLTLLSIFTTTPHLPSITTDSPPREALLPVTRTDTVMDLLHDRSIVMHADTTTPVGMTDAFLTLFPVIVGLPRYCGVSAPSTAFRWLLSVHSRYGPHNPLTS